MKMAISVSGDGNPYEDTVYLIMHKDDSKMSNASLVKIFEEWKNLSGLDKYDPKAFESIRSFLSMEGYWFYEVEAVSIPTLW